MSFKELYCAHFGCKPEEFEKHVLFRCLYWHASILGRLFWYVDKRFFADDITLIRVLAITKGSDEFRREISNFRFVEPTKGLLRRALNFRLSGRKAIRLADARRAFECRCFVWW
jgi:hypothetical protein